MKATRAKTTSMVAPVFMLNIPNRRPTLSDDTVWEDCLEKVMYVPRECARNKKIWDQVQSLKDDTMNSVATRGHVRLESLKHRDHWLSLFDVGVNDRATESCPMHHVKPRPAFELGLCSTLGNWSWVIDRPRDGWFLGSLMYRQKEVRCNSFESDPSPTV